MLIQTIQYDLSFLTTLMAKGGPQPQDYPRLTQAIASINQARRIGLFSEAQRRQMFDHLADAFSLSTMQGFIYRKPYGYAGDFEVIDRIYQRWVSPQPHLQAWDVYFHAQPAPQAVRNRKQYFHKLLDAHWERAQGRALRILNIGSGPARCLNDWLDAHPEALVQFDCVDNDPHAIRYATAVNGRHTERVHFHLQNALRLQLPHQYDLIWSSGLFDYFKDRTFVRGLKRLVPYLKPEGEIVIGNFSEHNATLPLMEFTDWHLHHRSPDHLKNLMHEAGLDKVSVAQEPEGVNLFVHAHHPEQR
jgi:SAM-dependent methyltransferase